MRKILRTLPFLCSLLISGCGNTQSDQIPSKKLETTASPNINLNGRSYRLYVPDSLPENENVPLLLALHGGFGNSEYFEDVLEINYIAKEQGFIIAYPNGTEGTVDFMKNKRLWNSGNCCGIASDTNVDDVGFLKNVINDILSKYPVDIQRVYMTGHSNGAMMSYKFICEESSLIAAMVGIAGQLTADVCNNASGVEVMHIHGIHDIIVPTLGGSTAYSAKDIDFRSVFETRNEVIRTGASFNLHLLPDIGHKLSDINEHIETNTSKTLAEVISTFLLSKQKK